MTAKRNGVLSFSITGGLVISALIWGGGIQAKVERSEGVYKILQDINTRLSRIEGALGVKKVSDE